MFFPLIVSCSSSSSPLSSNKHNSDEDWHLSVSHSESAIHINNHKKFWGYSWHMTFIYGRRKAKKSLRFEKKRKHNKGFWG
jgi:hypothetical protein